MRVLVVALLLIGSGRAWAERPIAAIVNLSPQGLEASLVAQVEKDLRIAGYALPLDATVRALFMSPRRQPGDFSGEKTLLDKAQAAYEAFELRAALQSLESFDRSWREKPATPAGQLLLGQRYLLGGLIRFAEGNESKARDNFRLSHRLRPAQLALPASHYRPAVVELYAAAVRDNQSAPATSLAVKTTPPEAELFVDGIKHGLGSGVALGPHLLRVHAPGFQDEVRVILPGDDEPLALALAPQTSEATLRDLQTQWREEAGPEPLREIATRTDLELLVLIRLDEDLVEAMVYRPTDSELGPWLRIGSLEWSSALRKDPIRTDLKLGPSARNSAPWYRRWWGGGLIAVGTSAAVGTALYFLLSPGDSNGGGVTIDQWCIGSCS